MPAPIVLASTSLYRRQLLERLGLPFTVLSPAVDETPCEGERPAALAARLALAKAEAGARQRPEAVVIGSDQVAELDDRPINKPETHARAVDQLLSMSGREVTFHTALCVLGSPGHEGEGQRQLDVVETRVRYRRLGRDAIERYLAAEPAYDCAGSARIEALGVSLVESVVSEDPTALVGLPLIRLCAMLRVAGHRLP